MRQYEPEHAAVFAQDVQFSEQLPAVADANADEMPNQASLASFRTHVDALLAQNQNQAQSLEALLAIAKNMQNQCKNQVLAKLWHLAALWFGSLLHNDEPLPHYYVHLLAGLDYAMSAQELLADDTQSVLWLENLLIDIYVQLSTLKTITDDANHFITQIHGSLADTYTFFPHILAMLEEVLFQSANGQFAKDTLKVIQERLAHRGWSFYESYVGQILADIDSVQNDDDFAQMQWQINAQLQDLYTAIFNTHDTINYKIGEGLSVYDNPSLDDDSAQNLRQVRILVEEIKLCFNDYLHHKDPKQLPPAQNFANLDQIFAEIGVYDAASMADALGQLFAKLQTHAPQVISWQFAHALADCLSLLELFLDGLAKEVFDNALLTRAKEKLDDAAAALANMPNMAKADEFLDQKPDAFDGVRYDDTGEVHADAQIDDNADVHKIDVEADAHNTDASKVDVPDNAQAEDGQSNVLKSTKADDGVLDDAQNANGATVAATFSPQYLEAKQSLKPDSFDFDEDIKQIFIEEADEVLQSLNELLPIWQKNLDNHKPLTDIRRGFHTLKGSGRMVGAFSVGEMAWAVENMLNRVLDGTLATNDDIKAFIDMVVALIPQLVDDFAAQKLPSVDVAKVVLGANNLLKGRNVNDGAPNVNAQDVLDTDVTISTDDAQNATEASDALVGAIDDVNHDGMNADDANANDLSQDDTKEKAALPDALAPFLQKYTLPKDDTTDVDEDIKQIFIEEAAEVLEVIVPAFKQYQKSEDNTVLTDIRRGFHTLKGSGRMVGAHYIGEMAWAVENMLNRVLDKSISMTVDIAHLVEDVLTVLPSMVQVFENGGDYDDNAPIYTAYAHAYAQKSVMPYVLRPTSEAQAAQENTEKPQPSLDKDRTLHTIAKVQQALSTSPDIPQDEEARKLCDIFVEEARDLMAIVRAYLDEHEGAKTAPISDKVVRAFHTMRGAANLPALSNIAEVGEIIEKGLQSLQKIDAPLTARHLQGLDESIKLISSYLDRYESKLLGKDTPQADAQNTQILEQLLVDAVAPEDKSFEIGALVADIDDLLDAELLLQDVARESPEDIAIFAKTVLAQIEILKTRTTQSRKFLRVLSALSLAYEYLQNHPDVLKQHDFISALQDGHDELTRLFDSLAGSMSLKLNEQVVVLLEQTVRQYQADIGAKDVQSTQHSAQAAQNMDLQSDTDISDNKTKIDAVQPPAAFEAIDTDDELLQIFLEEAKELDEQIGKDFALWQQDLHDMEALKSLQRHLHTVKGGARLAGITSIGDLTHEAESIYEQMIAGRITPTQNFVRVMQSVQDILSLQIEQVAEHKRAFFVNDAVQKLQSFLENKQAPDDAQILPPALHVNMDVDEAPKSDFEQLQEQSWQNGKPDDEILQVFLQETDELVEKIQEEFALFKNNTSDAATLQSLQRHLHTIKGGARMVLADGLADLAHHMETVYEDLASRRRPATRMVIQLLMNCHDFIAQALTLLQYTLNPPRPDDLIKALGQFSKNPDSLTSVPTALLNKELAIVAEHKRIQNAQQGVYDISQMPPMVGTFDNAQETANASEMIRISAPLMEQMINLSSEAAINRARIDMSISGLNASIEEMGATVQRLADQLRRMDIELEAQILAQIDEQTLIDSGEFDPLEMDQYSSLNQLSKSLSESASDLLDLKTTLLEKTRDGENLLLQLSRTQAQLQDGLMNSRMVPFSRLIPRLQRLVRQISGELGKQVELSVMNADDEMDRTILERITSPLEHMLRNAMDHGIEMPKVRKQQGKSETGTIVLQVEREGGEILIHLKDDGAGINVDAVRQKAITQGLIDANDTTLTDIDVMQYIFNAGLSTTSVVTQISGRGVGMDVVRSEIRQLGGSVSVDSVRHKGSTFTMRVPLTVAMSDALIVRVADQLYGIPLVQIERVTQVPLQDLMRYYESRDATFRLGDGEYRLRYLNEVILGHHLGALTGDSNDLPVLVIKNQTGQNLAVQVDEIVGSRTQVVVKPLGRQLSHVAGISAGTIMGDGRVLLILDLMALMRNAQTRTPIQTTSQAKNKRPVILVVDDSVTVRKVTSRFLERQGFQAVVAKDGMDAVEILQELHPDLMLLDIEMPRMDGFEVATQVRHSERLKDLPIIMITSRTGEKHRERAFDIGVSDYMGKPFQENELLEKIHAQLAK